MEALTDAIGRLPETEELFSELMRGKSPALMTGLSPVHRAHIAAYLARRAERPLLFVVAEEREAERLADDLAFFLGKPPVTVPARSYSFREGTASRDFTYRRLAALHALTEGTDAVIVTAEALLQRCLPKERLLARSLRLAVGDTQDVAALAERLVQAGYERTAAVEGAGQFSLRGDILDIFSPAADAPVRMEFFDNEIDAMGVFDVATQRRTQNVRSAFFLPAGEFLPADEEREALRARLLRIAKKRKDGVFSADAEAFSDGIPAVSDRYLAALYGDTTLFDYLPAETLVVFGDSVRVSDRMRGVLSEWKADAEVFLKEGVLAGEFSELFTDVNALAARLADFPLLYLDALPQSRYLLPPLYIGSITAKQLASYGGSLETAAADLQQYRENGAAVLVLAATRQRAENLAALLADRQIPATADFAGERLPQSGEIRIAVGAVHAGFEYPALRLTVLTEGQFFATGKKASRPRRKKDDPRQKIASFTDLNPGDLVVHAHHGLGRYAGLERIPVDGVMKDYIKIVYAAGDSLYVPATSLDMVSKYIGGGEEQTPARLNRLGGTDWARTKQRAKAAARDIARELVQLYAERMHRPGYAFSPDSPWQKEFEADFEYEETDDQLRAIEEIKRDMERPVPMERLLCGDVGYGKTEVALRAVMKCILDGKQAAILVPTTVLAQQHYQTAIGRFGHFPVRVAMLSRFQSAKESRRILSDLKAGQIDLLIGTHRLLQKNIVFRDLGLLVVDEEQRFGVTHKEKLKEMARQVDVLTLSATPIPRTLNMALTGIRDMSTIEEPPQGRQSVQTFVLEHNESVLTDAIRRELARGGQVYYLHNRIETIDRTAVRLQQILGEEARVAVAHGKLSETELSDVMQRMADGDADVLVCTTLIETGIDIPNVNTLIIEDADRLGLAQLHQIRGRIGRSPRRAYAYMTYRPEKILTEIAVKRLSAIREFVEFGSGFRIAMRDLEIRGAGNILGSEQSGYMSGVGYDMYLQLLEEAVLEEKGEKPVRRAECSADLTVNAHIPDTYIAAETERMDFYRRIAAVRTAADADDVSDELTDRYGDPPACVLALLDVALLRAAAMDAGISDITQRGNRVTLKLAEPDAETLAAVCSMQKYRGILLLRAGDEPALILTLRKGEDVLSATLALVEHLRKADPKPDATA